MNRFTIGGLMAFILVFAVGLAALRAPMYGLGSCSMMALAAVGVAALGASACGTSAATGGSGLLSS